MRWRPFELLSGIREPHRPGPARPGPALAVAPTAWADFAGWAAGA